jgi:hypothetical protein
MDLPNESPNILWITTDQQHGDAIQALGNAYIRTSSLAWLCAQGTVSWPTILIRQAARRYKNCAFSEGVIRLREDLAIEIKRDRLLIQRGKVEVGMLPGGIRHPVNALAEVGTPARRRGFLVTAQDEKLWASLTHSLSMNSSAVTPACFKMPRKVPTASSRCRGTTQPTAPSGVFFLSIT